MQSILDNIIKPSTNIDIIGNIFICDELCNLSFQYQDHKDMSITNRSVLLEIDYENGSYINYNGGESFGSEQIKYYLKKIVLIGPAKHFIKSYRRNNSLELILIHVSEDQQLYQNISILLYGSDSCSDKKKIQHKLLTEISDNIPTKQEITKNVKIENWSANDLLPDNKSFYTYNSPTNPKLNWIVFKEEVCVPTSLVSNYYKYVLGPNKELSTQLLNAPIPTNPDNLILFAHQIVKNIPSQCAKKLADANAKSTADESKVGSSVDESKVGSSVSESKEDEKKEDVEKKEDEDKKDEVESKEEEGGMTWWKWLLIIIVILVLTIVIAFLLVHFMPDNMFGIFAEKYLSILYYPFEKIKELFEQQTITTQQQPTQQQPTTIEPTVVEPTVQVPVEQPMNNGNKRVLKNIVNKNSLNQSNIETAKNIVKRIRSNKGVIDSKTANKLKEHGIDTEGINIVDMIDSIMANSVQI